MNFLVVAIGASAGGLEAASELLAAVHPDAGVAYLVVQHLDPEAKSLLPDLLSKITPLKVQQAQDGVTIQPDHVYVIAPNATLTLKRGRICVEPRASGKHHPVDALFMSLAEERGENAIAIVLSGGDSDGALGIQAIKHSGGITFAQTPDSASIPSMPLSAIDTGCVDFVLRPKEIAQEVMRLSNHPYLGKSSSGTDTEQQATLPPANEKELFGRVLQRLRKTQDVDFLHYKRNTLQRRLARRMALLRIENLADYVETIETDAGEAQALYRDFLIHVTGFFRDAEYFAALGEQVIPQLCDQRPPKQPLRVWVPGCASGEEVYSIAMLILEHLGERAASDHIQIFGTDISETAIEKARAGVYFKNIADDISAERLARFFVAQNDRLRITKEVRAMCTFARHDVTRDPPFSRLDLISCRNLLIYLDAHAQRRIMQMFHYALRPQGMLILGSSESVGQASDLFERTNQKLNFFKRIAGVPGISLQATENKATVTDRVAGMLTNGDASTSREWDAAQREADSLLLTRYAPASVVIDEALNILQFRGETSPYLEHASGPPSLNLHRVARPELLVEIISAVTEAHNSDSGVRKEGLHLDERTEISIEVLPLQRLAAERSYLVLFEDGSRPLGRRRSQQPAGRASTDSEKDLRIAQLEREITAAREYMQAAAQEHDAIKQELKSAHEEVLSSNEELQSTNEELETAKEELQSTNEELTTTNEELRSRNEDLATLNTEIETKKNMVERARAYADVIIETVREPLLVLDSDLSILRANAAFYTLFGKQRGHFEQRFLHELGSDTWGSPSLRAALEAVLTHDEPMSDFAMTHTFSSLGQRHLSLNARKISADDKRTALILLSIEDVTELQASANVLRTESRRKDEFLAMLAHELRNPLSPIMHTLHLLRRMQKDQSSAKQFDIIERQTARLVRLVDELLDVARINRGLIDLKRESLNLCALVQHTADASRSRFEARKHTVSLELPDKAIYVYADPVRLEQVLSNVLENAAKYTDLGGQITLSLTQDKDKAVISVRDNGIGIAQTSLEQIFELFAQADHSLVHSSGGLGLGLTVVRRILELHGGSIKARSAGPGQGSEFVIQLPIMPEVPKVSSLPEPSLKANTPPQSVRRVLLVDDNEDSVESMAQLIRTWGHEVAIAHDAQSALGLAKTFAPDTAFIDIGMPGMNGYELARHFRAGSQGSDLQLVAITGYGQAEDRRIARNSGFDAHFVKPAPLEQLQTLLSQGKSAQYAAGGLSDLEQR